MWSMPGAPPLRLTASQAAWALASPEYFAAYVRNPKQKNANSHMPANPSYDDATLEALAAYFRTFQTEEKP